MEKTFTQRSTGYSTSKLSVNFIPLRRGSSSTGKLYLLWVWLFLFHPSLWSAPADTAPIDVLTFNLQCQNNNTPNDPSDDTFTFSLIASHPSSTSTWNTMIGGLNFSGNYDRAYSFGPYPVNGGNLNFIYGAHHKTKSETVIIQDLYKHKK